MSRLTAADLDACPTTFVKGLDALPPLRRPYRFACPWCHAPAPYGVTWHTRGEGQCRTCSRTFIWAELGPVRMRARADSERASAERRRQGKPAVRGILVLDTKPEPPKPPAPDPRYWEDDQPKRSAQPAGDPS